MRSKKPQRGSCLVIFSSIFSRKIQISRQNCIKTPSPRIEAHSIRKSVKSCAIHPYEVYRSENNSRNGAGHGTWFLGGLTWGGGGGGGVLYVAARRWRVTTMAIIPSNVPRFIYTVQNLFLISPSPPPTPLRPFHLSTLGRRAGAASLPIQRRPLGLGRCILKRIPRPSVFAHARSPWHGSLAGGPIVDGVGMYTTL